MKKQFTVLLCLGLCFILKLHAQVVNIPDLAFKAMLLNSGLDINGDGEIQTSEAALATYIDVSSNGLSSLVGIEAFVNVQTLYCYQNNLTSLDVSTLTNMVDLACGGNSLTSLTLGNLPNLQILGCNLNSLSSLNLSGLTGLTDLDCSNNPLNNLNVSTLLSLHSLFCRNNLLSSLNVSALPALWELDCRDNNIINLDISTCPTLINLYCDNNQLQNLIVKNGQTGYTQFAQNPNLQHICADADEFSSLQTLATSYGLTNLTIDGTCNTLAINAPTSTVFEVYPNPAQATLNIETSKKTDISIFNLMGEKVISISALGKQAIDISSLPRGIYWLREKDSNQGQKFIKE